MMAKSLVPIVMGLVFPIGLLAAEAVPAKVSFQTDVMAALSKAGCNLGTCHGNKHGKGGFKLSLRGQSPEQDYLALTHDLLGRRVNPMDPDQSLILQKPTLAVPHEGGKRFDADSPEYQILKRWIENGRPGDLANRPIVTQLNVTPREQILFDPIDQVQFHAEAVFSDGTTRDVTRLAVYEPAHPFVVPKVNGRIQREGFGETTVIVRFLDHQVPVRVAFLPARPDFVWRDIEPNNRIDTFVFRKLEKLRIQPSPVCDETVFLRRAYLDLTGKIPSATEAQAFLEDKHSNKRNRLIEDLLTRPDFADFWALKWSDLLRNEEKTLDRKGVQNFHAWIRNALAQNKPFDQFTRELIVARGSTYKNPPANYYRAMRDPFTRAETTAQLFFGVRLQCAKCHNHPFDRWTQADYYGWSNLFARVEYKILENNRRDKNDKHEFNGEQIVFMADKGDVKNPQTNQTAPPQFLGAGRLSSEKEKDRLQQLAVWLTHPENTRFAEMQVNRIWFHLMGRGLVDPIDDFRATNPASHPELLDWLAEEFVNSGFDLRHIIRLIMQSKTYQLSSEPNDTNREDLNFSHGLIRRLTAEQILDSLSQVIGSPVTFNGYPKEIRASQIPGVEAVRARDQKPSLGDQFLTLFGKPPRLQSCECERSEETTLNQAFQLVSGPLINELLTHTDNRLQTLLEGSNSPADWVEALYWSALNRPPSSNELDAAVQSLQKANQKRQALEDVAWALLNSHEFMLRR